VGRDVRGDHTRARGQQFQDRHRHRFVGGHGAEHVGAGVPAVQRIGFHPADEADLLPHSALVGECLEGAALGAVPGDHQAQTGRRQCHGLDDAIDLLVRLEASAGDDHRPLVGERLGRGDPVQVDAVGDDRDARPGRGEVGQEEIGLGLGHADDPSRTGRYRSARIPVRDVDGLAQRRVAGAVIVRREDQG
jgi:hypothetical protein